MPQADIASAPTRWDVYKTMLRKACDMVYPSIQETEKPEWYLVAATDCDTVVDHIAVGDVGNLGEVFLSAAD